MLRLRRNRSKTAFIIQDKTHPLTNFISGSESHLLLEFFMCSRGME